MSPLAPDDAELARHDPELPALALLLDEEALGARLRREVPGVELGALQACSLHYRPARRCLVTYRAEIGGSQVALHARGWRSGRAPRFDLAASRDVAPGPFGDNLLRLGDLDAAVLVFPYDLELGELRQLDHAERRAGWLGELAPERPDLHAATLARLAYQPTRGFAGLLVAEGGARAVVKLYSAKAFAHRARAEGRLASTALLRLPSVLGASDRLRALLIEWQPGALLSERLLGAESAAAEVEAAGAALAELHAQPGVGLRARGIRAEVTDLVDLAATLGTLVPERRAAIAEMARRLASGLEEGDDPVPVHGDLHAKQILIDRGRIGLLDLDRSARSARAEDFGSFLAYLDRYRLTGALPAGRCDDYGAAFLAGYWRGGGRLPSAGAIGRYRRIGLLRFAIKPFRNREPGWRERIGWLLDRVAEAMPSAGATFAEESA